MYMYMPENVVVVLYHVVWDMQSEPSVEKQSSDYKKCGRGKNLIGHHDCSDYNALAFKFVQYCNSCCC